jgi:murein L,D-transpeptidase YafK
LAVTEFFGVGGQKCVEKRSNSEKRTRSRLNLPVTLGEEDCSRCKDSVTFGCVNLNIILTWAFDLLCGDTFTGGADRGEDMRFPRYFGSTAKIAALACAAPLLAACEDTSISQRSLQPIPRETVALMGQIGTTKEAPVLIRTFKKEAELEIWKMRSDGRYVHLKTYPMCRWSGQLGPKVREGDRQAPEGFYSIGLGQLNPNSNYYLSFNVGYPNAYDRAWGHTGGSIMVHGACSSAGCFSMTDNQIAEIYAIARSALYGGGQRAIQMQSYPFKMTAENLAKHRLDPNIGFWKQLKEGSDHFEVTRQEPSVGVCGKRYVFNAEPANGQALDPNAACPALKEDPEIKALVAEKASNDAAKVAQLATRIPAVRVVYQDGGQHPAFHARVAEVSRPEALAAAPVEIALEDKAAKSNTKAAARAPVVSVASAKAAARSKPDAPAPAVAEKTAKPAPERSRLTALALESSDAIGDWLGLHNETPAPVPSAPIGETTSSAAGGAPHGKNEKGGKVQGSTQQASKAKEKSTSAR